MKKLYLLSHCLFCLRLLVGCGDQNAFESLAPPTPAEKAAAYLENENPDAAISTILDTLGDTYRGLYTAATEGNDNENQLHAEMLTLIAAGKVVQTPNLISILASAQAQKYSIDPFAMVLQLASGTSSSSSSALTDIPSVSLGPLTQLYSILPTATADNITGIQSAIFILRSIGSSDLTKADNLKLGLFLVANLVLILKSIDTNEDGIITPAEAEKIAAATATAFITILEQATLAFLSSDLNSSKTSAASGAITNLQTTLQEEPGTTDTEKLRAFFAQAQSNG